MRLHHGAIPEDPSFQPAADGWASIKEPGPILLQFVVLPIALLITVLLVRGLILVLPHQLYSANSVELRVSIWPPLLAILFLIPMHELLHALCMPKFGLTEHTLIGVWPQKLLLYTYYDGILTRERFLLIQLMPFCVLTLLPLLIVGAFHSMAMEIGWLVFLAVLSVLNGVAASGDLLGAALILFQIPARALLRNQGWRSYWKHPVAAGQAGVLPG